MTLNDYQKRAMETCMPTCENFSYMMLNLVGEVGEFASKVAKAIRKDEAWIGYDGEEEGDPAVSNQLGIWKEVNPHFDIELQKEAGDIMWQLFGLMSVMGWDAEDIARQNLEKLKSRKERNVIDGNGDNR